MFLMSHAPWFALQGMVTTKLCLARYPHPKSVKLVVTGAVGFLSMETNIRFLHCVARLRLMSFLYSTVIFCSISNYPSSGKV